MDLSLALLAVVVFVAHAAQTMSGFGGMIICVTLGAHLYSIPEVLTLTVPLSLVQLGYVAIRHHRDLDWRLLLSAIVPLMGVGLVAGIWLADRIALDELRIVFAVLVLVLSARELAALLGSGRSCAQGSLAPVPFGSLLASAGLVHGVYASGGPLVVYAVSRRGMGKRAFRSTLTAVWLIFNIVLTARYGIAGRYGAEVGWQLLLLLPAIPLGIWCGEVLHNRVDERRFAIVVHALLIAAGLALLVS